MSVHRYKLGQFVSLASNGFGRPVAGRVEIVRLMPASVDGELHYRVRGPDKLERAAAESQLSLSSTSLIP